MQNSDFWTRVQVSMGSRYDFSFCACTVARLATELLVSMGPRPHLWFWLQNSVFWDRIISLYWSQSSPVVLCRKYVVISTRITSLYWSQTPPVILCMQNRVIRTRISILHESQPSSVVLCIQNSAFMTRITCMYGSQTSTVDLCMQNSVLTTQINSLYGSQTSSVVFACKTATLGLELQVSVGPRPHLWFLHAKQRFLDQNNKSLWVPDMTCHFVHVRQRD